MLLKIIKNFQAIDSGKDYIVANSINPKDYHVTLFKEHNPQFYLGPGISVLMIKDRINTSK